MMEIKNNHSTTKIIMKKIIFFNKVEVFDYKVVTLKNKISILDLNLTQHFCFTSPVGSSG